MYFKISFVYNNFFQSVENFREISSRDIKIVEGSNRKMNFEFSLNNSNIGNYKVK